MTRIMNKLGIHFRILFSTIALIFATTCTIGYISIKITNEFTQTRFKERFMFLAKYLSLNAELGILIDDKDMLKRLAQNLLSEKDVVSVTILNNTGEELAKVSKNIKSFLSTVEFPVLLKDIRDESQAFIEDRSEDNSKKIIGNVKISYSSQGINSMLFKIKKRIVYISIALSLISIAIFYFISRSIVFPVTDLAKTARQVAKGDVNLRFTTSTLPETRELANAFNSMLDSLNWSNKALEDAYHEMMKQKTMAELGKFSLMIAHEFKNPLSIIKSSFDILKKDIDISSDNVMAFYIEDEIKRMNKLIEDFLRYAKPINPCFRLSDLNLVVKDCIEKFELQNLDNSIKINADIPNEPLYKNVDPDLLAKAINNIIKNAYEAIESNGSKKNIIIKSYSKNTLWIAEIEDSGKGITKENISKIFEPFFTTKTKGTGLGLAFVKQVINAHNGEITAKNGEEGGALFKIEL
ncbi:MAG: HAMP domain-containing histidine kinase [Desulfobacterales bacterium]|nr:HAMP domain-containing histidine kinase [Desulfobacterales bacterium]